MTFIYIPPEPEESVSAIKSLIILSTLIVAPFILFGIMDNVLNYVQDWEHHEFPYNYISAFYCYSPYILVYYVGVLLLPLLPVALIWNYIVNIELTSYGNLNMVIAVIVSILYCSSLVPLFSRTLEIEFVLKLFEIILNSYKLLTKKLTWVIFFAPAALGVSWFMILAMFQWLFEKH